MILVIIITLITSRLILKELGFVDFGLYNVVAGFVSMFIFFGNSLSNAAQRFFSVEIGKNDREGAREVFSVGAILFFLLSLIIVLLLETFGLWFIYNKLTIPENRLSIVIWVFHLSVAVVFLNVNSYIFKALIVAKEDMRFYAQIGVIEAILKLLIVLILHWLMNVDKLLLYALLFWVITIVINLIYAVYCLFKFNEVHLKLVFKQAVAFNMFRFIGWSSFVSLVEIGNQQGANLLLNIYFGPVINAARGIAYQVSSTLQNFGQNIYTATRPQMIKSFVTSDIQFFLKILHASSKAIYFFILTIAIPLYIKLPLLLDLWLDQVPDKTLEIGRLLIISVLVDSLRNPLWASAQAKGKLKNYAIYGGVVMLLYLPISYLLLYLGFNVESVFIVFIFIRFIYLFVIWIVVQKEIHFLKTSMYLKNVILPIIFVTLTVPIGPFCISFFVNGFMSIFIVSITSLICSLIFIYLLGLSKTEKLYVVKYIQSKFS